VQATKLVVKTVEAGGSEDLQDNTHLLLSSLYLKTDQVLTLRMEVMDTPLESLGEDASIISF
jgi:hypothetical protein